MDTFNANFGVHFGANLGPNITKRLEERGSDYYKDTAKAKEMIKQALPEDAVADLTLIPGVGDVVTLNGNRTKQQPVWGRDCAGQFMQFAEIIKAESENTDKPVGYVHIPGYGMWSTINQAKSTERNIAKQEAEQRKRNTFIGKLKSKLNNITEGDNHKGSDNVKEMTTPYPVILNLGV